MEILGGCSCQIQISVDLQMMPAVTIVNIKVVLQALTSEQYLGISMLAFFAELLILKFSRVVDLRSISPALDK